jgi:hypothetical protein
MIKKQYKSLIIMALFLLIITIIMVIMSLHTKVAESNLASFAPENTKNASIFNVDMKEIAMLELTSPTQYLILEPNENDLWQITNHIYPTINSALIQLINSILKLHIVQTLPIQDNLSPFGLDYPPMRIELHLKNQQTLLLNVGFQSPSGQTFYAQMADNPTPILISATSIQEIMRPLSFFIDTQLPTIDTTRMTQINIENHYGVFRAYSNADQRFGTHFTMSQPFPSITLRTDRFDKNFLGLWDQRTPINVLNDYEVVPQSLEFYALAYPVATLLLQDETGSLFNIAIGKRSSYNSYYAKEISKPSIWQLPSDLAESVINFNPWNMINLTLIHFNSHQLDTIIFEAHNKRYVLKHNAEKGNFTLNESPISESVVQIIQKNLFSLHYSGITEITTTSDAKPLFTITIVNDYGMETWEFLPTVEQNILAVRRNGINLSLNVSLPAVQQLWDSVTYER